MKKSASYRETFRQHRKLLSVPIVLAVVIAAWSAFGAEKSYMSTLTLWVDNAAPAGSSLGNLNPAVTPPSQQEQQVVTELLAAPSFALSVGHHSLLASYLAAHPSGGMTPTALLNQGSASLNDRIISALGPTTVLTTAPGPQVLQISFTGPTPAVAQSTLTALVTELRSASNTYSEQHNQSALVYYRAQVQAAQQSLKAARNQANQYLKQNPRAPTSDPNLSALTTAEGAASTQLTQANASLSGAASALKGSASGNDVQVITPASEPSGPVSGKKKQIMVVFAGLFAGLLIAFLGTIALTRKTDPDPWEDELAQSLVSGPSADALPRRRWATDEISAPSAHAPGSGDGHVGSNDTNGASRALIDPEAIGDVSRS